MSVTIKDISKYTGLSIGTISKFINGGNVKENNKVIIETACKELNYKVNIFARGLKTNKTMAIGVVLPSLSSGFFATIISSIEKVLIAHNYITLICVCDEDIENEKRKIDFLLSRLVDGIIIAPTSNEKDHINKVLEKNIPVVIIDRMLDGIECDTVLVDNINASYTAIETLFINGHTNIGIICGPKNINTTKERVEGYYRVYKDYNMEPDESMVKYGNYQTESGYNLFMELWKSPKKPTAVFITNYDMTLGAMMAVSEEKIKIPDELSIIGFDYFEMTKLIQPRLTIVSQPMQKIGQLSAQLILERMKQDKTGYPSLSRLKTDFIVGDSIKKLS